MALPSAGFLTGGQVFRNHMSKCTAPITAVAGAEVPLCFCVSQQHEEGLAMKGLCHFGDNMDDESEVQIQAKEKAKMIAKKVLE